YQIQAAIAASHAEASTWQATDWSQIFLLYDALLKFWPTPVVQLNRAIAMQYVSGPAAALQEVDSLAARLDGYHLFHATRAQMLRALRRHGDRRGRGWRVHRRPGRDRAGVHRRERRRVRRRAIDRIRQSRCALRHHTERGNHHLPFEHRWEELDPGHHRGCRQR